MLSPETTRKDASVPIAPEWGHRLMTSERNTSLRRSCLVPSRNRTEPADAEEAGVSEKGAGKALAVVGRLPDHPGALPDYHVLSLFFTSKNQAERG
jgi:hypothetical protein